MADAPPPRRPRPAPDGAPETSTRPSVERALTLRDAVAHAVEEEREAREPAGPPRRSRTGRTAAILVSIPALAFCVYSLIARPEFIWGPRAQAEAPVAREANLRMTMFLLGQRVRSYRRTHGSLPALLADVGENPPGIRYTTVADTVFELRAMEDGREVVFRSDGPVQQFLGDAPNRLRGRAP